MWLLASNGSNEDDMRIEKLLPVSDQMIRGQRYPVWQNDEGCVLHAVICGLRIGKYIIIILIKKICLYVRVYASVDVPCITRTYKRVRVCVRACLCACVPQVAQLVCMKVFPSLMSWSMLNRFSVQISKLVWGVLSLTESKWKAMRCTQDANAKE